MNPAGSSGRASEKELCFPIGRQISKIYVGPRNSNLLSQFKFKVNLRSIKLIDYFVDLIGSGRKNGMSDDGRYKRHKIVFIKLPAFSVKFPTMDARTTGRRVGHR